MNYRYHQSFKVEKDEDRFKVIAQCKRYGSMGPDPGREVWRETIVENVSREYADMLQRELTKSQFEDNDGRENILQMKLYINRLHFRPDDLVDYDFKRYSLAHDSGQRA